MSASDRVARLAAFAARHIPAELELLIPRGGESLAVQFSRSESSGAKAPRTVNMAPLSIDYSSPSLLRRYHSMSASNDALLRAVGFNAPIYRWKSPYVIFDATAGVGRDAGALAFTALELHDDVDIRVVMCERNPVMASLLCDGLWRARQNEGPRPWLSPPWLSLVHADSAVLLATLSGQLDTQAAVAAFQNADPGFVADYPSPYQIPRPQVVYLDPMFDSSSDDTMAANGGRMGTMLESSDSATAMGETMRPNENSSSDGSSVGTASSAPSSSSVTKRTAAPKRELQYLAALAGPSSPVENETLLRAALGAALKRVVVKRHHGARPIGEEAAGDGGSGSGVRETFQQQRQRRTSELRSQALQGFAEPAAAGPPLPPLPLPRPDFSLQSGKAVRYDVYLTGPGER